MKLPWVKYATVVILSFILYLECQIHTEMYRKYSLDLDVQRYKVVSQKRNKRVLVAVIAQSTPKFLDKTLQSLNNSEHEADVWIFKNFTDDFPLELRYAHFHHITYVNAEERTNMVNLVFDKFISSNYSVLVYINSYSILTTNWWDILKRCLDMSSGIISLYGMDRNNSTMCIDLLCNKTWLGFVGSVWRKNIVAEILAETKYREGCQERNIEDYCKINSIPLQTVRYPAMTLVQSKGNIWRIGSRSKQVWINNKFESYTYDKDIVTEQVKGEIDIENNVPSSKARTAFLRCIAAVIMVRIYRDDKPELTAYELEQWVRYVQFAGVDKIYLYDAYEHEEEKLHYWVKQIFEPNEIIYHDWYFNRKYKINKAQSSAYQHAIDNYKNDCEWHLQMDMDEYPFVLKDYEKGFLKRLVQRTKEINPDCTELSFQNFLFVGYPAEEHWLIERLQRRLPNRANALDKPLCMAKFVANVRIHHNYLANGKSVDIKPNIARMNHYWGARMQKWKPDTPESLSSTISDSSVLPILKQLKNITLLSNRMPMYVTNRFWNL